MAKGSELKSRPMDRRWGYVASIINERLAELAWTQKELERRSGVSDTTLRNLQHARADNYRPAVLAAVSRALGWPPDALERISHGATPPEPVSRFTERMVAERLASIRRDLAALEEELRDAAPR